MSTHDKKGGMMDETTTFNVTIALRHVQGPPVDAETLLDALCATIGRQNGAKKPVRVEIENLDDETTSTYEVDLMDDRPEASHD